jgi:hypothetical protein
MNSVIIRGIQKQDIIHIRIWDTELSQDKQEMFSLDITDDELDQFIRLLSGFIKYEEK